ncbi:MAG: DUF3341 domain-containing protein [Fimbriimonadales bacterium]|nr:DUF3341 domain-containing protein [Fimbriimonadales bacterium]
MAVRPAEGKRLYGILGEFPSPEALRAAARHVREAGFTHVEAYTPFPVEDLVEDVGRRDDRVPVIVFLTGVLGALGGFGLQTWVTTSNLVMNVGGRPDFSWPAYIPITFECGVLCAAFGALIGMLVLNGLPELYHPLFDAKLFERVTTDKFVLCIESHGQDFQPEKAKEVLTQCGAIAIEEVRA